MTNNLVVHIIDDDDAVRDSVKTVLEASGFTCATYSSAFEFLAVEKVARGCALIDVRMPEMDGITLLSELAIRQSNLPVIVMTGFADVPLAVKAMKEGAVDFVEKPTMRDALVDAVQRALDKTRQSQTGDAEQREALVRLGRLTQREREVMELLVGGDANKIVAHKLGISPRTVEIHRGHLMEKTQSKSLAELVRMALAAGISRKNV